MKNIMNKERRKEETRNERTVNEGRKNNVE
jgi:hypothetical protein